MPNDDYIKRSDAVSAFCGNCEGTEVCGQLGEPCEEVKQINAIPAADVEPVRHGKWVRHGEGYDCSECKKWVEGDIRYSFEDRTPFLPVYCPFCGAKMDKE